MNLKASLFNKSITKSDFRRLWWVCALNTIFIFVTFTLNIVNHQLMGHMNLNLEYSSSVIARYGYAMWRNIQDLNSYVP